MPEISDDTENYTETVFLQGFHLKKAATKIDKILKVC